MSKSTKRVSLLAGKARARVRGVAISVAMCLVINGCASVSEHSDGLLSGSKSEDWGFAYSSSSPSKDDTSAPEALENPAATPSPPAAQFDGPVTQRQVPTPPRIDPSQTESSNLYPTFPPNQALNVTVSSRSVPEFINAVFGDLLGLGFVLGPGIEEMDRQVALRSVQSLPANELFDLAVKALEDYGVGVYYEDGILHFVEYEELRRTIPLFIKNRARRSVPSGLRPVVQYVQLVAGKTEDVNDALREAFGSSDKLNYSVNGSTNSVTLRGMPNEVNAALDIINSLDSPDFAGITVELFRPRNWTAQAMVTQLVEQLTVEGFSVSNSSLTKRTINILPIPFTNQVAIYTKDPALREYVLNSAIALEQAAEPVSEVRRTHVYRAQYYDVQELAVILDGVVAAMNLDTVGAPGAAGAPGAGTIPTQTLPARQRGGVVNLPGGNQSVSADPVTLNSGRIVVDIQGNRLIFFGTNEEFSAVKDVLGEIDVPGDEVLIEVSIAEITINEETRAGIEFLFDQMGSNSFSVGTLDGIGLASGGLTGGFTSGEFSGVFNAFASSNQINILSEPRIVTKSGSAASIQVGDEVPFITTQSAASTQLDGSTDILQSVEFRSTGILLDIEPIVFSDNRIDLAISQEVSSALPNENAAIPSPVFSNRLIVTELSLQDGQTAIMGGLIDNSYVRGQTGVPILKDLPLIGAAFRTQTFTSDQTVLIVTITPFIINDPVDRQRSLNVLREQANAAFRQNLNERPNTLTKPRVQFQVNTSQDSVADGDSGVAGIEDIAQ
ncbi:MAG: secretin N-terminal domain-containing protein [Pseudomonadota bacterium]